MLLGPPIVLRDVLGRILNPSPPSIALRDNLECILNLSLPPIASYGLISSLNNVWAG